jgi:hypothetical protein
MTPAARQSSPLFLPRRPPDIGGSEKNGQTVSIFKLTFPKNVVYIDPR